MTERATAAPHDTSPANAESPVVTVLTEATTGESAMLRATARSLVEQTLQAWSWVIVSVTPLDPPIADQRVRMVDATTRAAAMAAAFEESDGHIALVEAGVLIEPTTLEKWTWFLHTHSDAPGVLGTRDADDPRAPRLLTREAVVRAGGIDAAYARLRSGTLERIPYTGWPPVHGAYAIEPEPRRLPVTAPNAWIQEDCPCKNHHEAAGPRLLLITPWMTLGGADKFNLDLLPRLRASGWEITVATTLSGDHALLPEYAAHTPDLFPLSHFLELVDYPRFLTYLIESRSPDVVLVSNSELGYRLLPYLRSRCPEAAYVDFCHSEAEHWINGGYPRLSVEYQEVLDLTVTASAHLRNWMIARGGDGERIHVCYANVDAEAIRPDPEVRVRVREELQLATDKPVILFVGRVSDDKQPDVLAETMLSLHERGAPFQLVLAGDGPDLQKLRGFFDEHKLADRVRLLGAVEHDRLGEIYAAADIVFLPSRSEGIALVLYEAMAAAIPVVAARVGGQAELVTAETGILVPRGTVAEEVEWYADAIAPLLADAGLRERMGRAARSRIEQSFQIGRLGERMEELLELATQMRQGDPRPVLGLGVGRAFATEAIELTRGNILFHAAWGGAVNAGGEAPARARSYLFLQRVGGPAYRWAVAHGAPGLPALRDGLRRRLMGF